MSAVGVVAAASMSGLGLAGYGVAESVFTAYGVPSKDLSDWLIFAFGFGFIVSLPFALFLGLPIFLVLRRLRLVSWRSALVVGFGIGIFAVGFARDFRVLHSGEVVKMGLEGAASALAFWACWRRSQVPAP